MLLFGTAITSFTYVLSFTFSQSSGSQTATIGLMLLLGLLLLIAATVLRIIPSTTDAYHDYIRYLFAIFPPFALGEGLNALALIEFWSLLGNFYFILFSLILSILSF